LNDEALKAVLRIMKVDKEIIHTSDYIHEIENDFREAFSPKANADSNLFPAYYQVFSTKFPFAPDLSILDLLFNEGPETLKIICQDRQS
jgi:hypothetical protein